MGEGYLLGELWENPALSFLFFSFLFSLTLTTPCGVTPVQPRSLVCAACALEHPPARPGTLLWLSSCVEVLTGWHAWLDRNPREMFSSAFFFFFFWKRGSTCESSVVAERTLPAEGGGVSKSAGSKCMNEWSVASWKLLYRRLRHRWLLLLLLLPSRRGDRAPRVLLVCAPLRAADTDDPVAAVDPTTNHKSLAVMIDMQSECVF